MEEKYGIGEKDEMEDKQDQKSNQPNYILIFLIIGALPVWLWFAVNGDSKKKEPNYQLAAQSYSQLYIKENYYSDAEFPTQRYSIVSQGNRYDVSGKFSHAGVVHTFEIIGSFPKKNTDEYHIEYVAIDNTILLDAIG